MDKSQREARSWQGLVTTPGERVRRDVLPRLDAQLSITVPMWPEMRADWFLMQIATTLLTNIECSARCPTLHLGHQTANVAGFRRMPLFLHELVTTVSVRVTKLVLQRQAAWLLIGR
jgi:hypothetical protein